METLLDELKLYLYIYINGICLVSDMKFVSVRQKGCGKIWIVTYLFYIFSRFLNILLQCFQSETFYLKAPFFQNFTSVRGMAQANTPILIYWSNTVLCISPLSSPSLPSQLISILLQNTCLQKYFLNFHTTYF